MDCNEAVNRLKQHEFELRQLGVDRLFMFGSTMRGDARADSDVDLFFDHKPGRIGLYELIGVRDRAAEILGRKADVITRNSLHPLLRRRIEEGAVQVF